MTSGTGGRCLARLFLVKQPTIGKGILVIMILTIASLVCQNYYATNAHVNTLSKSLPQPTIKCLMDDIASSEKRSRRSVINDHMTAARLRIDPKVLVLVETPFTKLGQEIIYVLEASRIKYKMELAGKSLPYLTHMDKGKYGVVIFEKWESYLNLDTWNRQLLDKYCLEYNVGIISFAQPDEALVNAQARGFPLLVHTKLTLKDYEISPDSKVLRVTRAGEVAFGPLPGNEWTVFVGNHSTYEPVSYAQILPQNDQRAADQDQLFRTTHAPIRYVTVIQDKGLYDGIQRVIFGAGLGFWLHRLLLLDALSFLSHGKLSIPLERYLLIDIDDIFVGPKGVRMTSDDVKALLAAQERLHNQVPGFHFNLGFSGKFFHRGTDEENKGDDMLLANKHRLWWFPHMWRHLQPHRFDNSSILKGEMRKNWHFAKEHGIPVNLSYAVAPHHSGVFPVHQELYDSWRDVWGIRVTSTEEYPHLRHARHRRGFMHQGIQVLPRQTCGLFTHTVFLDKYPGGRKKLESSIMGGELFQTFLYNPILVFMTHLSNYGNDRLALYTFESVVKFIQCWTNLQLRTLPPIQLAEKYFEMHPEETDAIWRNPCDDKRHLAIWSSKKSCGRLPNFMVLGPQKTGTTALYTFLRMHPSLQSNVNSPTTFEEVQFFNGKNYLKGLDWYMDFFPELDNTSKIMLFEKSANYFDSEEAPKRAYALLPHNKLIAILTNPAKRAYSWYQHMRAHQDTVALAYSFYEVITADENTSRSLRDLRHRCLSPGLYAQHIYRWLDYYSSKQMLILDGEQLKSDPISLMAKVQHFLRVQPVINYSSKLKYSARKGFYCQLVNDDETKCLGKSKGRVYEAMDSQSDNFLRNYYRKPNIALSKLLGKLAQPIPEWLEEELGDLR